MADGLALWSQNSKPDPLRVLSQTARRSQIGVHVAFFTFEAFVYVAKSSASLRGLVRTVVFGPLQGSQPQCKSAHLTKNYICCGDWLVHVVVPTSMQHAIVTRAGS